eukprot:scaffold50088_cov32-Tisochrysis_lutea.AAC.5
MFYVYVLCSFTLIQQQQQHHHTTHDVFTTCSTCTSDDNIPDALNNLTGRRGLQWRYLWEELPAELELAPPTKPPSTKLEACSSQFFPDCPTAPISSLKSSRCCVMVEGTQWYHHLYSALQYLDASFYSINFCIERPAFAMLQGCLKGNS